MENKCYWDRNEIQNYVIESSWGGGNQIDGE